MNAIEVAQNNFNCWNRHDADAIVAAYAKGGDLSYPALGPRSYWASHRRLC